MKILFLLVLVKSCAYCTYCIYWYILACKLRHILNKALIFNTKLCLNTKILYIQLSVVAVVLYLSGGQVLHRLVEDSHRGGLNKLISRLLEIVHNTLRHEASIQSIKVQNIYTTR